MSKYGRLRQDRPSVCRFVMVLLVAMATPSAVLPAEEVADHEELAAMSLEDLMNISVTSVSKREQRMVEAAAAVYVITSEDIRRSGANTIPELFRGVPGMGVAKLDANAWAVSIRGFNDQFSNKLLVLVDGRTVYTPLFSGVFWELNDLILEDIERIEIIRGPGATHWGTNAVNGVINITTKKASDAAGLFSLGAGSDERAFSTLRVAGPLGDATHYRLSLRYADRDENAPVDRHSPRDDWDSGRASLRLDYAPSEEDHLHAVADLYNVQTGETYRLSVPGLPLFFNRHAVDDGTGGSLLLDWTRKSGDGSELRLKSYYSREILDSVPLYYGQNTYDIELQHRLPLGLHHDLMWGVGYRYVDASVRDSGLFNTSDRRHTGQLLSAFLHDEMHFRDDRLRLSAGVRLEHLSYGAGNAYDSFEVQPGLRVAWVPNDRHVLWAAVSRAVRSPGQAEVDRDLALNILFLPFAGVGFSGSEDFGAEDLLAVEVGYRATLHERILLDLSLFRHFYDDLRVTTLALPQFRTRPFFPQVFIPVKPRNAMEGTAWGAELAADWQILPWWRARATYSFLELDLDHHGHGLAVAANEAEGTSPRHQIMLRSLMDLPHGFEFDTSLHFVDNLNITRWPMGRIELEAYWDLDVRIGWRMNEHFEAELVGQNLLRPSREEFRSSFVNTLTSEVQRGVYAKLTWRF